MNVTPERAGLSRGPDERGTAKINSAQNHVALITVREVDCTEERHTHTSSRLNGTGSDKHTRTHAQAQGRPLPAAPICERCRVAKVSCRLTGHNRVSTLLVASHLCWYNKVEYWWNSSLDNGALAPLGYFGSLWLPGGTRFVYLSVKNAGLVKRPTKYCRCS